MITDHWNKASLNEDLQNIYQISNSEKFSKNKNYFIKNIVYELCIKTAIFGLYTKLHKYIRIVLYIFLCCFLNRFHYVALTGMELTEMLVSASQVLGLKIVSFLLLNDPSFSTLSFTFLVLQMGEVTSSYFRVILRIKQ